MYIEKLNSVIVECRLCPRLVEWREQVGRERKKAHAEESYWAKPVPLFGDPEATHLIVGLAPAAHGANRTGRMFTGDRSGDWLYRALHKAGAAKHPWSRSVDDGQELYGVLIAAVCLCAPPGNKPLPSEMVNCSRYLRAVLARSPEPIVEDRTDKPYRSDGPHESPDFTDVQGWRSILCLGSIAWNQVHDRLDRKRAPFKHGAINPGLPKLVASFHPSQQNTFTGKLTEAMLDAAIAEWLAG